MSDSRLQEIITTAVVGRAERQLTFTHTMDANGTQNVLGMRVGETEASVTERNGRLAVELSVDCDLWCDNGTKTQVVRTQAVSIQDLTVETVGEVVGNQEIDLAIRGARLQSVTVENGQIVIALAVVVFVHITAMTRLWVRAYDVDGDVLEDASGISDESQSDEEE